MSRFGLIVIALLVGGTAVKASAGGVSLNGNGVPRATSTINASVDITQFREGGEPCSRLLPGCKHYSVCIATPAPIAVLDEILPQSAAATRFTVGVEDGRQFARCLLNALTTAVKGDEGGRNAYKYCFLCEDVTMPPG